MTTHHQNAMYEVEMLIGNSWENCWTQDGRPQLFASVDEAEQEIKDHITDCINAVEGGELEDSPDPTDFRVSIYEPSVTFAVDPARLQYGSWCHRTDKQIGQGDIDASYSADRIGMGEPIRKPFEWRGGLWVCVGKSRDWAQAYRLTHPQAFTGNPTTYREKVKDGDAARSDPHGFYHGMTVKHGGKAFILTGPPARLVPGEAAQLELF